MSAASLMDMIHEAKRIERPSLLLAAIPYAQFFGFEAKLTSSGHIECGAPSTERMVGNPFLPALHGGALGALLETACQLELIWHQDTPLMPKTINMTVDYLRSGRHEPIWASASIARQGRRVASVHAQAWQADRDKPVAAARAHFLIKGVDD